MTQTGHVHVVGAGLAGLAAATALVAQGHAVTLHEATNHAGGRCRSWHDAALDRVIDNGNHLILGANGECFRLLDRIGSRDALVGGGPVQLPFLDLRTGVRWTLRPGLGPLPWWLADPDRRVPGTNLRDYLSLLRLIMAGRDATVAECLPANHPLTRALWRPLALSILNTPWEEGSARLLRSVLIRTLLRGAHACRPFMAGATGLSGAFADPAVSFLTGRGARVMYGHRLLSLERDDATGCVTALSFPDSRLVLSPQDILILALPAEAMPPLLPDCRSVPDRFHAIVNAHFRLDAPCTLPFGAPFLGLVGGVAEWLFVRGDIVSVTISAADDLVERPNDQLIRQIWPDVAQALGLPPATPPPCRIIKERRATFAATTAMARKRPGTRLGANLLLAGDWTDTGLPATIEGAILSGHRAAARADQMLRAGGTHP